MKSNMSPRLRALLGEKIWYDNHGQMIFGENPKHGDQLLLDVRSWGAIQNIFEKSNGTIDYPKAEKFQDEFGKFVANAIQDAVNERDIIVEFLDWYSSIPDKTNMHTSKEVATEYYKYVNDIVHG